MELTLVKLRMGTMQEIMDSPELQKVAATVLEETVRARVVVQKVVVPKVMAVPPEMVILQGVVGAATDI
jgi:hypothetical protein